MVRQVCLQLSSTTPCPMLPHAEFAQPSRSRSVAYLLCKTRLGRWSNLPCMHSRLRACLASSARSCASAAAKRCSAAASTSSSASVRASNTWAHCLGSAVHAHMSETSACTDAGALMMFTFTQPVSELGACGEYGTIHTTHSIFLETGFDIFLLQLTCTTSALSLQGRLRHGQVPHMHSRLRACFTNSARSSPSAAATRCSAAASASARASVRAWCT